MTQPHGGSRWNSPPNWPAPPAGWTPPAGWKPDPAWGPAPDGWVFWVPTNVVATPMPRKPMSRRKKVAFGGGAGLFGVCLLIGVLTGSSSDSSQPTADTSTQQQYVPPAATSVPSADIAAISPPPETAAPAVPLSVRRRRAASILLGADQHFRGLLAEGTAILRSEPPYPDGDAGLAAMEDPTSAASRFSDFQTGKHPENDEDTQTTAFQTADDQFTADDEPDAINDWRDALGAVDGDFSRWEQVAGDYQISNASAGDLADAAAAITHDLTAADAAAHKVGA